MNLTAQELNMLATVKRRGRGEFYNHHGALAAKLCREGFLTGYSIKHRRDLGGVEYAISSMGETALKLHGHKEKDRG